LSDENLKKSSKKKSGLTVTEAAELAEAAAKAAAATAAAVKAEAEAALQKEYEEAAKIVAAAKAGSPSFTDKRSQERIFRREMGEPEFFHPKKDLVPPRAVLTEDEQEEVSRKVEIPTDQTPQYKPEILLSPEFGGTSDYESGINKLLEETKERLDRLQKDPRALAREIDQAEQDLKYLVSLQQNFFYGMNVFRTAKGGRSRLKE
jgi:colicin import membrane protein